MKSTHQHHRHHQSDAKQNENYRIEGTWPAPLEELRYVERYEITDRQNNSNRSESIDELEYNTTETIPPPIPPPTPSGPTEPFEKKHWLNCCRFQRMKRSTIVALVFIGILLVIGIFVAYSVPSCCIPPPTSPPSSTEVPTPLSTPSFPTIDPSQNLSNTPSNSGDINANANTPVLWVNKTAEFEALFDYLGPLVVDDTSVFFDMTSPQFRALQWLSEDFQISLNLTVENLALLNLTKSSQPSRNIAMFDLLEYSDQDRSNSSEIDYKQQLIDRYALAVLYFAMGGDNDAWRHSSGFLSLAPVCEWKGLSSESNLESGVICSNDHCSHGTTYEDSKCLQTLSLVDNSLQGTIPSEIALLHFQEILLDQNENLAGILPTELGRMNWLRTLSLEGNSISGTLPSQLLTNRTEMLNLGQNLLYGSIPPLFFSEVNMLRSLDLGQNDLTGTIPESIGYATSLERLNLTSNDFHGNIPSNFAYLTSLVTFDISDNAFTGNIQPSVGNMSQLVVMDLSSNRLNGSIPVELGEIPSLKWLDVSNNELTGAVHESLDSIFFLDLNGNDGLQIENFTNFTYIQEVQSTVPEAGVPTCLSAERIIFTMDENGDIYYLQDLDTLKLLKGNLDDHVPGHEIEELVIDSVSNRAFVSLKFGGYIPSYFLWSLEEVNLSTGKILWSSHATWSSFDDHTFYALEFVSGTLYGVSSGKNDGNGPISLLYSRDVYDGDVSGAWNEIGPTQTPPLVAITWTGTTLYGVSEADDVYASKLYSIDLETGTATLVCDDLGYSLNSLLYYPPIGMLLGGIHDYELVEIEPTDCTVREFWEVSLIPSATLALGCPPVIEPTPVPTPPKTEEPTAKCTEEGLFLYTIHEDGDFYFMQFFGSEYLSAGKLENSSTMVIQELVIDAFTSQAYVVEESTYDPHHWNLWEISLPTEELTLKTSWEDLADITFRAMEFVNGTLYGVGGGGWDVVAQSYSAEISSSSSKLYKIDLYSIWDDPWYEIGPTGTPLLTGMAWDGSTMFGVSSAIGPYYSRLYKIDLDTGGATLLCNDLKYSFVSLVYYPTEDLLLGGVLQNNIAIGIDPNNCELTELWTFAGLFPTTGLAMGCPPFNFWM